MKEPAASPEESCQTEASSTPELNPDHIFAVSAPIYPTEKEVPELEKKLSAPPCLFSLCHGELPPFKRPPKEPKPKLLVTSIIDENEVIEMVAAMETDKENGLAKFLKEFLPYKNVTTKENLSERNFLVMLVKELIDYAACRDFDKHKLAVLITIYIGAHLYFKWHYWSTPKSVWEYFRDIVVRHTVEDSPDGQEVFDPNECYDILTHFHTIYLSNLPLIHILVFGVHRLKFVWPFSGTEKPRKN